MADAQTEKYSNPKYNQDDFLDELIKKEIPGTEIKGNVAIIDGWAFELDRSVPKIVTPLGKADDLVFPTVTVSEVQLANNYRTATFTVTALEETNGINKMEIWLNGEKLDAYEETYTNIKTEISEDFTVNRNGLYTVKVYGKLMISKTVEVEGIVPAVKFTPNGSTEWKKEHLSKITVEQTGETVKEMKYLWKTGENEPQASEFIETCTDNSTITGKELTGKYYLWVLLKTDNDKTSICGSEEFYFDNEGPEITYKVEYVNESTFKISANCIDNYTTDIETKIQKDESEIVNSSETKVECLEDINQLEKEFIITSIDSLGNKNEIKIKPVNFLNVWKRYKLVDRVSTTGSWGAWEESSWKDYNDYAFLRMD